MFSSTPPPDLLDDWWNLPNLEPEVIKKLLTEKIQSRNFGSLESLQNILSLLEKFPIDDENILKGDLIFATLSNHFFLNDIQNDCDHDDDFQHTLLQAFFISALLDLSVKTDLSGWIKKTIKQDNSKVCVFHTDDFFPNSDTDFQDTHALVHNINQTANTTEITVTDLATMLNNSSILKNLITSKFILCPAGFFIYSKEDNDLSDFTTLFKNLDEIFGVISIPGPQYLAIYKDFIEKQHIMSADSNGLAETEQLEKIRMSIILNYHKKNTFQTEFPENSKKPLLFFTLVYHGYGDLFFGWNAVSSTHEIYPDQRIVWVVLSSKEVLNILKTSANFETRAKKIEMISIRHPGELYTNLDLLKILLKEKAFFITSPGGHSYDMGTILPPCIQEIVRENGVVNYQEYNFHETFDNDTPDYLTGLGFDNLGIFMPQVTSHVPEENSIYKEILCAPDSSAFFCYTNKNIRVDESPTSVSLNMFLALVLYKANNEWLLNENKKYENIFIFAPIKQEDLPAIEEFLKKVGINEKIKKLHWCEALHDAKINLDDLSTLGETKEYSNVAEKGIEVYLVNPFPLPNVQMEYLMQQCSPLCMVTGDQTYGRAIWLGKLFFYQTMEWKRGVLLGLLDVILKISNNPQNNGALQVEKIIEALQRTEQPISIVLELEETLKSINNDMQAIYLWFWLQNNCHVDFNKPNHKEYLEIFLELMTYDLQAGISKIRSYIIENQDLNKRLPKTLYAELQKVQTRINLNQIQPAETSEHEGCNPMLQYLYARYTRFDDTIEENLASALGPVSKRA